MERNSIQFNKYHIAINKHEHDERGCEWNERERERKIEKAIPSIVISIEMKHQK